MSDVKRSRKWKKAFKRFRKAFKAMRCLSCTKGVDEDKDKEQPSSVPLADHPPPDPTVILTDKAPDCKAIAVQTDIPYVYNQLQHRGETMNHRSTYNIEAEKSLSSTRITSQGKLIGACIMTYVTLQYSLFSSWQYQWLCFLKILPICACLRG
jgi:hypothetical protein